MPKHIYVKMKFNDRSFEHGSPSPNKRMLHYHSDGQGRDTYIKSNEGGIANNGAHWKNEVS